MTFYFYNDGDAVYDNYGEEYPDDNAATDGRCLVCGYHTLRPSARHGAGIFECACCGAEYSDQPH